MPRPIVTAIAAAVVSLAGLTAVPAAATPRAAGVPGAASPSPDAAATAPGVPPVKHVWVVLLENKSYAESFSPVTKAPYLLQLAHKGAVLQQYFGTAHFSLPNYLALISGQGPNVVTQADCPPYVEFVGAPGGPDGQAIGQGCIYPAGVHTVADQLQAKGLGWKGYMGDLGNDPSREDATHCGVPTVKNGTDDTQNPTAKDQYAARHNPFVYFHSLVDGACVGHVVALEPSLSRDLAGPAANVPAYSFVTPNLCDDGHDSNGCTGPDAAGGRTHGLSAVDSWLRRHVPGILASRAYADGGMLVVTWDEAAAIPTMPDDGTPDATGCCDEQTLNTPRAGGATLDLSGVAGVVGSGGGRTGAVVLSPYIKAGTTSAVPYNHYGLLRTVEDLFGLDRLGYAGQASGVSTFGSDVFTNYPLPATSPTTPTERRTPTREPAKAPATRPVTAPRGSLAATGESTGLAVAALLLAAAGVLLLRRRLGRR
jgi:hypothetical protein